MKTELLMNFLKIEIYNLKKEQNEDINKTRYLNKEIGKLNKLYTKLNTNNIPHTEINKYILINLGLAKFDKWNLFLMTSRFGGC